MRTGLTKKQKTTVIYFDEPHDRGADPQHRSQKAADGICGKVPAMLPPNRR